MRNTTVAEASRRWCSLPALMAGGFLSWGSVHALSLDGFPGAIAACVNDASCTVDPDAAHDNGVMSAFHYAANGQEGYLLRYALHPTSVLHEHALWYDIDADTGEVTGLHEVLRDEPLSGTLWMKVAAAYPLAGALHDVTLYLDRAHPDAEPLPRWGSDELYPYALEFSLTTDAMLAGSAGRVMELDAGPSGGDLGAAQPLLPCLADGCGVRQRLNLVFLDYRTVGDELELGFSDADRRALLYLEASHHEGDGYTAGPGESLRAFNVQLPLPAAGWLFGSVLGLIGLVRRKAWFAATRLEK